MRLYERALAVKRKAFGDRHPEVAESSGPTWRRGRLALGDLRGALEAPRAGVDTFRCGASTTARSSPADCSFSVICCAAITVRARRSPTSKKRTRSGARTLGEIQEISPVSRRRSPPPALHCDDHH